MNAYTPLGEGLLYVDFRYHYGDSGNDFGMLSLDSDMINNNNVVSFTIPAGETFSHISMTLTYIASPNKEVIVFPYSGTSSSPVVITLTAPLITTTELPDAEEASPYSASLSALGSTPITWSLLSGDLPTGLSLDSSGSISGTPSAPGSYSFTVYVQNSKGSDSAQLSLNVSDPPANTKPTISTETPPPAATGIPYTFQLMAAGTPPFNWTIKGSLHNGLSISDSGLITSTPTTKGKKKITFTASNDFGTDKKKLTIRAWSA